MRRETQNLLLLLLGGAVLKSAFSGSYLHYVKPSLFPWLIVAGATTTLLAVAAITHDIRGGRDGPVGDDPVDDGPVDGDVEAHAERGSRSPWMLLLPVFAIFLVVPPALGSDSVGTANQQMAPQRPEEPQFAPLPRGVAPPLRLSEFVTRAVWDTSGSLNGRAMRLQGFITHSSAPGDVQLTRMRITCCAADASPVRVNLAGPEHERASRLPADTWIEVTATLQPGTATEATNFVPAVTATDMRPVPAPPNPYEY